MLIGIFTWMGTSGSVGFFFAAVGVAPHRLRG